MPSLSALATAFTATERPIGNVLDAAVVLAQAVAAAKMYAGYGTLAVNIGVLNPVAVTSATIVTESEWAVMRPLFLLYVERETALYWESSRVMGADAVGRSSSEAAGDIAQLESELPHRAFSQPIVTV